MNASERRSVLALASVISSRMLGLFLLLPVLALYAASMSGATPFLVGLALGAYGLTQALFQLAYGYCSDRFGRKGVISVGLLIFIAGSVVAAVADTLPWLIVGRAIQGAGAVSAAVLALTADLTREEQRTKAMALIGISIGAMFLTSMVLAPLLSGAIGVAGLFWLTGGVGVLALVLLHGLVPTPSTYSRHRDITPTLGRLKIVLLNPQLLPLNFGIFILHLVLTALFVILPMELVQKGGLVLEDHWKVYLPVVILSVIGMAPLISLGSRSEMATAMFRVAVAVLLVGQTGSLIVIMKENIPFLWLAVSLWVYFIGFNTLEAMLPALISRVSPAADKGSAVGLYSTFQFAGVFIGGTLSGWLAGRFGTDSVLILCTGLCLVWFGIACLSRSFSLASSRVLRITEPSDFSQVQSMIDKIRSVRGVQEVTVVRGEALAYLKVDDKELDIMALEKLEQYRGG